MLTGFFKGFEWLRRIGRAQGKEEAVWDREKKKIMWGFDAFCVEAGSVLGQGGYRVQWRS